MVLRSADIIIRRVVVFDQTFVERFAFIMNTIAETFAGFCSVAVIKLPHTSRESVVRQNAVKIWNDEHKKDQRRQTRR